MSGDGDESIMVAPFPEADPGRIDAEAEGEMAMVMGVIDAMRNIRGEMGFPPAAKVEVQIRANGTGSFWRTTSTTSGAGEGF